MVRRKVFMISSAALLNAATVGIASTYSSTATESMKSGKFNPNDEQVSWIGSILPLGAVLGGIVAGYLSDKIGRKGVMIYSSLPLVLGWLLIAYAPTLSFVYAGRFITGVFCGLICVVTPMYIVEISTSDIRGKLGSRFQLYICEGIILSSVLGKFLPWEWVAASGAILAVVTAICMLFIPESPRWLVIHNQQSRAVQAVDFIYGKVANDAASALVNELVSESLADSSSVVTMREMLLPTFYKPALLSVGLMFFQQFSGSNAILYYTVSIFKQSTGSIDPAMGNLFVALTMMIFTGISSQIVDRIGRKCALYISGVFTFISLNCMSLYLVLSINNSYIAKTCGWIPILCLLVYIAAFSMGFGPIPWLMMSEMSPIRGRGIICGFGTAFSWIFVFVITKTFLEIESLVGNFGAYWIYSAFCLLACVFTFYLLPETKGKSLEEIELYFQSSGRLLEHSLPSSSMPIINSFKQEDTQVLVDDLSRLERNFPPNLVSSVSSYDSA